MIGWPHRNLALEALRQAWQHLPTDDTDWAFYVQRDEDGMVHASPLLSGSVSTWASLVMEEEQRG